MSFFLSSSAKLGSAKLRWRTSRAWRTGRSAAIPLQPGSSARRPCSEAGPLFLLDRAGQPDGVPAGQLDLQLDLVLGLLVVDHVAEDGDRDDQTADDEIEQPVPLHVVPRSHPPSRRRRLSPMNVACGRKCPAPARGLSSNTGA